MLTTWHRPLQAAAAEIDISCPPGPQQQTSSSGFAAVRPCCDRQTNGHRAVSQTLRAVPKYQLYVAKYTGQPGRQASRTQTFLCTVSHAAGGPGGHER